MKCPNCGGRMITVTYPNGWEEEECQDCGMTAYDNQLAEEHNEKYGYEDHWG